MEVEVKVLIWSALMNQRIVPVAKLVPTHVNSTPVPGHGCPSVRTLLVREYPSADTVAVNTDTPRGDLVIITDLSVSYLRPYLH